MKLILASASPRRRVLLRKAGYKFKIIPSDVSEAQPRGLSAPALVKYLALKKAVAISKRHPNAVVIGADTLVFLGRKVIGKPRDPRHAARILGMLSNRWQRVYTGVAVVTRKGKKKKTAAALSYVKFRRLSQDEITRAARKHLDKAGAYAVQKKADNFVEKIRGDYDNVVGLPVRVVRKLLRAAL